MNIILGMIVAAIAVGIIGAIPAVAMVLLMMVGRIIGNYFARSNGAEKKEEDPGLSIEPGIESAIFSATLGVLSGGICGAFGISAISKVDIISGFLWGIDGGIGSLLGGGIGGGILLGTFFGIIGGINGTPGGLNPPPRTFD